MIKGENSNFLYRKKIYNQKKKQILITAANLETAAV